jgi:phosphoglycolate phosphatase
MQYQAVLFDLDGTLIDSLQDLADATNRTLLAHGFPTHPVDAYRYFVGDGARNLILRALPPEHQRDDALIARCLETYSKDYGSNWNVRTCLYPGIAEMLDGLAARGLTLTLLSNKPDLFTQACARKYLSKWDFRVIMGAKPPFAHKPDPAAALEITRRVGLPADHFLYLGDTATDMQTALNAGMYPLGASWGFRPRQELRDAGARAILEHPTDP